MSPARGRPATLTREAIERAVLAVGFNRATTTVVAAHLGVDQSSLYRHIASKSQMLADAANRAVLDAAPRDNVDTWQDYVREVGESIWQLLRSHPGLTAQFVEQDFVSDGSVRLLFRCVKRMVEFGWTVPDAVLVIDSVSDMTVDAVHTIESSEQDGRENLSDLAVQMSQKLDEIAATEDPVARELGEYVSVATSSDPKLWWSRKLELIIAGADQLHSQSGD